MELTADNFKTLMIEALVEYERSKSQNRTYTRNQVRKRLGMAFETLDKRIKAGLINTTGDGRIAESEINRYLQNC